MVAEVISAEAQSQSGTATAAFKLTLPDAAADLVRECYGRASSVLEYGSGGSTVLAMQCKVPQVFSVESDRKWAKRLSTAIGADFPGQPCVVHHVDIGRTKVWGYPADGSGFANYHAYATSVWDLPGFVQPDVVLIDGRFRVACLLTVLLRTSRPVTVLFDDYVGRPYYRWVEELVAPTRRVGRMAEFLVQPGIWPMERLTQIVRAFADPR